MSHHLIFRLFTLALLLVPATLPAQGAALNQPTVFVPPHTWPAPYYSPGNNMYNSYEHTLNAKNVRHLQHHPFPNPGYGWSGIASDVVGDGMLFEDGTFLTAISLTSRKVVWTWRHPVSNTITYGKAVYFYSQGSLYSLTTHTGTLNWQMPLSDTLQFCCQAPTYASGELFTGIVTSTGSGWMEGIDATNGAVAWRTPVTAIGPWAYGVYKGQSALFVVDGGNVEALNSQTGAVIWTWVIPNAPTVHGLLYADRQLYVATVTGPVEQQVGRTYVVDPHGKVTCCIYPDPIIPTAEANGIVVGIVPYWQCNYYKQCWLHTDQVGAYSAVTFRRLWLGTTDTTYSGQFAPPVVANGLVYIGADDGDAGAIFIVEAVSGVQLTTIGPSLSFAPDALTVIVDGKIYLNGVYFSLK